MKTENNNMMKNPKCPKCKTTMEEMGDFVNDVFYCNNRRCYFCGISRQISPWIKNK